TSGLNFTRKLIVGMEELYAIKLSAYCHLIPPPPTSDSRDFLCHFVMEVTFGHISLKLRKLGFRTGSIIRVGYADTKETLDTFLDYYPYVRRCNITEDFIGRSSKLCCKSLEDPEKERSRFKQRRLLWKAQVRSAKLKRTELAWELCELSGCLSIHNFHIRGMFKRVNKSKLWSQTVVVGNVHLKIANRKDKHVDLRIVIDQIRHGFESDNIKSGTTIVETPGSSEEGGERDDGLKDNYDLRPAAAEMEKGISPRVPTMALMIYRPMEEDKKQLFEFIKHQSGEVGQVELSPFTDGEASLRDTGRESQESLRESHTGPVPVWWRDRNGLPQRSRRLWELESRTGGRGADSIWEEAPPIQEAAPLSPPAQGARRASERTFRAFSCPLPGHYAAEQPSPMRDLAETGSPDAAAAVRRDRLHPRQVKLLETLSEYEIASPIRVNALGEPFPTNVHFKRRRRSLNSASDPWPAFASSSSSATYTQAHYRLSAFGQQFLFNLTAHAGFIAPMFTVTLLGAPGVNQTKFYSEEEAELKHCFYKGHVNTKSEHTAVISLCSGMLGTFRSHDGDYFIEPLLSIDEQEEHKNSHSKDKRKTRTRKWGERSRLADDVAVLKSSLTKRALSAYGDKTDSTREKRTHRRTKRFLSYPRFVEVMVVADNRMVLYHGANLQHYILTLMSIVASIYKDPSIGNLINIVIVNLVVIHNEQEGPSISFNAQTTLKNFCQWQHSKNHPGGIQHDTAVLVTRQDICRAHDKCDTLGLAELGTICDPYRSCSISEDSGLSTAFTIAHELGHVFNMPHDDNNKCKEEAVKSPQHVMAPTLNFYTNPWMWSKCSRKYITEFLDTGYGECLLNEPESRPYPLPLQLPGLLYNVNKQCELIFGPGSQVCPYMHCKFGFCVPKEMEVPVTDGSWGSWSHFGTCSRTCGGGIKTAVRECNRPEPKNGGKYCVGRRMKFKSCNTEPCPKQKRDFRDEQCAHFDGKHFNINGLLPNVRWVPKYSGILMKDRCKLFCRVAGNTAYYQLRDRVVDGTPCGQDTNDICVQGLCRQAGCDHVLNSKARRDKCGVCGGDNSSCKTVAGTFNTVHYGYNVVVRIPAGATSIDVRQHSFSGKSEDDNYLALSSSKGEFLLNGDFVVTMSKREIRVGNAVIEYSGSDNVVERINSTDRIEQELLLQVLSVGKLYNPDVRYSFNIPIEDKPQQFYWNSHGPWQACSKPCQGERKRKPVCTRESDQLTVSDQRCDRLPQPAPITEPCGTDCDLRWHVASRSECSAQCGLGYRTIDIYCARYSRLDGKTEKVDDSFCSSHPKPSNREKCSGECNTGGWRYSAWTECSKSCDGGSQRRRAICVNTRNDVLDDSKCTHQEKVTVQKCNEFPCPQWKSGDWSECLVTCGKGHKHRQVWCQFGEDRLNDRICDSETKPASMQTCQQPECASWQAGPWGQCSVTCGQGYQLRAVKCIIGTYMSVVDDNDCNAATRPTDTQCSATCGKGTRMRYVSCRDEDGSVADDSACATLPRPVAKEECSVTPCGRWKALDWNPCSVTCGQGRTTRQVVCVNYSDHVIDQIECDPDYIPETDQDCSMSPCPQRTPDSGLAQHPFQNEGYRPRSVSPSRTHVLGGNQWRTGPWGACSSTCAGGSQRRVVVCQDENGYTANDCVERIKPDEQRSCESGPCPQWAYGSWGECTKLCGGGLRTRLVVCQRPSGERFLDLSCEILDKPPDREQCNTHACPQDAAWSTGPWSSASFAIYF
ncbi:hypothetical protein EI555_015867, partial [Monodon monoceros]